MNRSDERAAAPLSRKRSGRKAVGFASLGFLALGLTVSLPVTCAQAQFFRGWGWQADDGPPPIPPRDVGRPPGYWRGPPPETIYPAYSAVPVDEIRRRASRVGLHLLATPHRKGDVYIAFGEDAHGLLHRLVFDAHEGRLVKNDTVDIKAKTQPIQPAIPASAQVPRARPAQARAAPAAANTPAAAAASAPTVTARELSPIEPQPGVKPAPRLKDSEIDKD
ncbi:hypothetical protein [Methylovirgula sp. HY1]|uniref:hypothetical protein n=1 Tax=Methylovirgula sp. HY1 TaxID=2822761 RepID=UPI001C5B7F58|nr:hypothetical protein [Methylovirgula sp. HY1]QXX74632.1 hypothetical protein MHY1_01447 [Methylovirgula sp. HY1]